MKSKLLTLILILFTGIGILQAQNISISGTVSDANGTPLPGVTIVVKNTAKGASTDFNGNYVISDVTKGETLVFSYVGFIAKEVVVGNSNKLNVQLEDDTQSLDEVVVIGYGSVKKKDATGAVAVVSEKDFQKGYIKSPAQLIANKVPGVQITSSPGAGPGTTIRIRGGSSLNASNDPLIVIDGVPTQNADAINKINPNDIASFSVLKDASATAIYGSRGSNGVILITTKRGSTNDIKFTFSSQVSSSSVINKEDVLTGDEYRELAQEAADYTGVDISTFDIRDGNTDWQDEIFRSALSQEHNFSMAGGLKKLPYRLSLGYMDNEGVVLTNTYKRTNVALNLNPRFFKDHLKVDVSLKMSNEKARWANNEVFKAAITFNPTMPVYDENSPFGGYSQYDKPKFADNPSLLHGHFNPVSMLLQDKRTGETLGLIGNLQLDYKFHFLEDLRANVNFGYERIASEYSQYMPETNFAMSHLGGLSIHNDPSSETDNITFEGYLNYVKEIASIDSKIDVMAGYSYYDYKTKNYNYQRHNAFGEPIPPVPDFDFNIPQNTLISFYGRLNYQYKDKYVLTATVRRDGSSRFSEENRWAVFPSAAFAWKIGEEGFMKNAENVSDLKLRVGYGVTGQQDGIGNYGYITSYHMGWQGSEVNYPFGDTWHTPIYPSVSDKDRRWEETATTNLGVDYGFYNDRLSGSIDVYKKETTDLLNQVNIPAGTSFATSMVRNIGSMENKGVEFAINAIPVQTEDFSWSLGYNFNYNENEITSLTLDDTNPDVLASGSLLVSAVGHSKNAFYTYHQVYDTEGNPIENAMVDVNNDGIINGDDKYISESSIPKYLMGFNTSFNYKKWSLDMAFHANIGHYLYYGSGISSEHGGTTMYDNLTAIYALYEFPKNINRMYYDHQFKNTGSVFQPQSDLYLQNASFLKMDNINVNYSVGEIFKSFNTQATLDLYASVQNVFTITNYTGKDPEHWGLDGGQAYPTNRTFTFGLNLNF
jgi:TonB-linked SusC/RagA family outer membrane protein